MSTINTSERTHLRMLPQSVALEFVSADNPGVGTKRGTNTESDSVAGVGHGRGERHQSRLVGDRHGEKSPVVGGSDPTVTHPKVFVLDKDKCPLMPCHPSRARELLCKGRARVHKLYPFTIRLVDRTVAQSEVDGVQVKIDPGSKCTGIAVARVDSAGVTHGLFGIEVRHRGALISKNLTSRAALRRGRRTRNLRYRAPRFLNRSKPAGWLAPSLRHRVETTQTWVNRLSRIAPVTGLLMELVRFDMQALVNPEISGVEYQQGTLFGFEVREYLLNKWGRKCAYCDATDAALNIDHVRPRSRGGSNRISNLVLACIPCNESKSARDVAEFVTDPKRLARILSQAKRPLRDASAVNSTRWALFNALGEMGLPVLTGSGGRTKWIRTQAGLPKSHVLDALCVGDVGSVGSFAVQVLVAKSTGRGSYKRTATDKYGFPNRVYASAKRHHGFQTGDMVRAIVPRGKYAGAHRGRVAVRATGRFDIATRLGKIQGINWRFCRVVARADGWSYSTGFFPALTDEASSGGQR